MGVGELTTSIVGLRVKKRTKNPGSRSYRGSPSGSHGQRNHTTAKFGGYGRANLTEEVLERSAGSGSPG